MRLLLIMMLFISTTAFSQVDTTKKVKALPDSAYIPNDTIVLKIPKGYLETFIAVMTDKDFSHKIYLQLLGIIDNEIKPQIVKRPVKK